MGFDVPRMYAAAVDNRMAQMNEKVFFKDTIMVMNCMRRFIRLAKSFAQNEGLSALSRKLLAMTFWNSFGQLLIFLAIRKCERESESLTEADEYADFAMSFGFLGLSIKPLQIEGEIAGLLEVVRGLRPKYILEIGTCSGGSLFVFSRIAAPDAVIISVDLPRGDFGGGYPIWKIPLFKSFARQGQSISLIRGDSHNERTLERVKTALRGNKVDFLFIDGDHTYGGAKKDFETYSVLVRKDGIVALHDVAAHKDPKVGVSTLWAEIRDKHNSCEIVSSHDQGWAGIGFIRI